LFDFVGELNHRDGRFGRFFAFIAFGAAGTGFRLLQRVRVNTPKIAGTPDAAWMDEIPRATSCAMNALWVVSPFRMIPRQIMASTFWCWMIMRAAAGISKAPGTQ